MLFALSCTWARLDQGLTAPVAGEVNADYKNKYRTLLFNLKDAHNPELRARVLMGDIPPAKLVRMTSEQLASKVPAPPAQCCGAPRTAQVFRGSTGLKHGGHVGDTPVGRHSNHEPSLVRLSIRT